MASRTQLEQEVAELRQRLTVLEERARLDSVASAFIAGVHEIREGDYFLLYGTTPTKLTSISSEGKWTYFDGRTVIEPFRIPDQADHDRLYTIAEVAEIVARVKSRG